MKYIIMFILIISNTYSQELSYKKQKDFVGLLDANIEINKTYTNKPIRTYKIECCDTRISSNICVKKCGNNCKCRCGSKLTLTNNLP